MIPNNDPLVLLAKLADHPHGLELANLVYQLYQEAQADTQADSRQVLIAFSILQVSTPPRGAKMIPNNNPSKVIELLNQLYQKVNQLYQEMQEVKERLNYVESDLHYENCNLKDRISEWESKRDDSSEDN